MKYVCVLLKLNAKICALVLLDLSFSFQFFELGLDKYSRREVEFLCCKVISKVLEIKVSLFRFQNLSLELILSN